MLQLLAKNWWIIAVRGVLAILFGILALALPGVTLLALVLLWGIYALVDGASSVGLGLTARSSNAGQRWMYVFLGIVGILAGLIAIILPGITAVALLVIMAIWAVLVGLLQLFAAVWLGRVTPHAWFLGVTGGLTLALGVILLANPGQGALALTIWIGCLALLWGIVLILLGLRLRGLRDT